MTQRDSAVEAVERLIGEKAEAIAECYEEQAIIAAQDFADLAGQ